MSSPLGEDVLLFRRMAATERMSRLYDYDLDLLSEDHDIKFEDILGQNLTVNFERPDGETRFFNGFVSCFEYLGTFGNYARYHARVSPWLWFLSRTANCRIFQHKAVPDIVKQIFQDNGYTDFKDNLSESYEELEYCVQYRETDLNFVSRLMEEEGIFYYFQHQDGKHNLILGDGYTSLDKVAGYEEVAYHQPEWDAVMEKEHVWDLSISQEVQPGAYRLRDFDFKKPKADLESPLANPFPHEVADKEIYDYPGRYLTRDVGDTFSRIRLEEMHAQFQRLDGEGDVSGLLPGHLFTLVDYPRQSMNIEYLTVDSTIEIANNEYESLDGEDSGIATVSRFHAIDSNQPYRPERATPKPIVEGPHTAIVVGPSGEEIWTNEYGQIKVQFHWDREGQNDENSSCWLRVTQAWASRSFGALYIPRMGDEVIVGFLEGDPDRPIVIGCVYNADTSPPHDLPGGKVISGFKTNSTKGGGGYNEYIMDDTKGNELIREHGQFDKDSTIEHDLREHVLNNRSRDVGVDETIEIGHDQTYTIGNNQTGSVGVDKSLTVGSNHTEMIGSNMTITVARNLTEGVGINYAETVGAAMELTVGAAMAETVGQSKTQTVGTDKSVDIGSNKSENVGANKSVTVGENLAESVGANHDETVTEAYSLSAKTVAVTAADEITLNTGKATINMKKNGDILIDGKKITIKGTGDVIIKGKKILEN